MEKEDSFRLIKVTNRILMKALYLSFTAILLSLGIYQVDIKQPEREKTNYTALADTSEFDQKKAIAKLREQIKGLENDPSGEVYKNIQMLNRVPAGRLISIMEMGYSRSLGVTCIHCHDPENWSSDEKAEKVITREMSKMVAQINNDLLADIEALGDRTAIVNCTTCHRGQKKPALNMDDN
ncbi:MAG TPA: c-type cytochrome [Balneola sp.]|jgi:hypothetical protein|nr:hypothetical protein [Bacteroidota bacterium]HCI69983.1 c-type cytochrome [Balneola sp.]HCT54487.1 c-type cytochrome [Balneola sp.]|tara:strand:+ start:23606 stop:24148 length:543 start_codon:yes stop_codon:yes gene_type:complete